MAIKTTKGLTQRSTLTAMLFFMATSAAAAAPMKTTGLTTQPVGHHTFCQALPAECQRIRQSAPETLTPEKWRTMVMLNTRINAAVKPKTDMEIWGVTELWSYPETVGDCEDYVLLKRHALMQSGFAPSNLLITVVRQPNGDGHAVLTVRTDRGDFILDNLRNEVLDWKVTEYTYLKRQSTRHAGRWEGIARPGTQLASNQ